MYVLKGKSWSQAFLAETVETGDKNLGVSQRHTLFCEESLGKIVAKDVDLFRNDRSTKSFVTLEQLNTSVKNLKTSMLRL